MIKFFLMLGLLALVFSCGGQEEPLDESKSLGKRFELKDVKEFTGKEKSSLRSVCASLAKKEEFFETELRKLGAIFVFKTEKRPCGKTNGIKYQTGAKIEYQNGQMIFEKMASGAVIFSEILLKNYGPLKSFCDKFDDGSLNKRFISSGRSVNIIYAINGGDKIKVTLNSANKIKSEEEYLVKSSEDFIINNANNKFRGVVLNRTFKSQSGCLGNQTSSLESSLFEIQNL